MMMQEGLCRGPRERGPGVLPGGGRVGAPAVEEGAQVRWGRCVDRKGKAVIRLGQVESGSWEVQRKR